MSQTAAIVDALALGAVLVAAAGLLKGWRRLPRSDVAGLLAFILVAMAILIGCNLLEERWSPRWLEVTGTIAALALPFLWVHFVYSYGKVCEQRSSDAALRAARDEAQNYLDVAGVMILALDTRGKVTMLNRTGCSVLGWSEQELSGSDWFETCIPPEWRAEVRQVFERTVDGERSLTEEIENPVLTRDGRLRHVAWYNTPLRDAAGRVVGVLCSGEDITARKQAEEALARSEQRFRALAETAQDGINICEWDDATGGRRLVFCNDRFVEMSGYTRRELEECEDLNRLITPLPYPEGSGIIEEHHPNGEPHFGMASWNRPDGRENAYQWSAVSSERDGKTFLFGFDRDVTERQRARRALVESEEQYRSTIEAMGDGVVVIDRDYRIVLANQAFVEHYASGGAEDVTGRDLFEVLRFLPPAVRRQYEEVFRDGKVLITEPTHTVNDRETILEVRKIPVLEDGTVARIVTLVRDVTARKLAEAALEKNEREKAALLNAMSEAVVFYNTDMRVQWANRAATESMPGNLQEQIGKTCHELWYGRSEVCQNCRLSHPLVEGSQLEADVTPPDGDSWWHVRRYPVHDGEGTLRGVVDVALDITERKRAELVLAQWAAVAQSTDDAIIATEPGGRVTRWNPGAAGIYGYDSTEALGTSILSLAPQERRAELRRILENVANGERVQQYETTNLTREGDLIKVALTLSPMLDERGEVSGISVIARDITEHVKLREELINLSLVDALTGLNNRRGFFHLASQQLKVARRTQNGVVLIFADVDNMKWINDSFGHQAGDRALVETADTFRRTFRESDIVGRIGGDEFAVLAVGAHTADCGEILARLQRLLDARNERRGARLRDIAERRRRRLPARRADLLRRHDGRGGRTHVRAQAQQDERGPIPERCSKERRHCTPWNRTPSPQTRSVRLGPEQARVLRRLMWAYMFFLPIVNTYCDGVGWLILLLVRRVPDQPEAGRLKPRTIAIAGLFVSVVRLALFAGRGGMTGFSDAVLRSFSLLLAAAFLWEVCRPVIEPGPAGRQRLPAAPGAGAQHRLRRLRRPSRRVRGRPLDDDGRPGAGRPDSLRPVRHGGHHGRRRALHQLQQPLPRRVHRRRAAGPGRLRPLHFSKPNRLRSALPRPRVPRRARPAVHGQTQAHMARGHGRASRPWRTPGRCAPGNRAWTRAERSGPDALSGRASAAERRQPLLLRLEQPVHHLPYLRQRAERARQRVHGHGRVHQRPVARQGALHRQFLRADAGAVDGRAGRRQVADVQRLQAVGVRQARHLHRAALRQVRDQPVVAHRSVDDVALPARDAVDDVGAVLLPRHQAAFLRPLQEVGDVVLLVVVAADVVVVPALRQVFVHRLRVLAEPRGVFRAVVAGLAVEVAGQTASAPRARARCRRRRGRRRGRRPPRRSRGGAGRSRGSSAAGPRRVARTG